MELLRVPVFLVGAFVVLIWTIAVIQKDGTARLPGAAAVGAAIGIWIGLSSERRRVLVPAAVGAAITMLIALVLP